MLLKISLHVGELFYWSYQLCLKIWFLFFSVFSVQKFQKSYGRLYQGNKKSHFNILFKGNLYCTIFFFYLIFNLRIDISKLSYSNNNSKFYILTNFLFILSLVIHSVFSFLFFFLFLISVDSFIENYQNVQFYFIPWLCFLFVIFLILLNSNYFKIIFYRKTIFSNFCWFITKKNFFFFFKKAFR